MRVNIEKRSVQINFISFELFWVQFWTFSFAFHEQLTEIVRKIDDRPFSPLIHSLEIFVQQKEEIHKNFFLRMKVQLLATRLAFMLVYSRNYDLQLWLDYLTLPLPVHCCFWEILQPRKSHLSIVVDEQRNITEKESWCCREQIIFEYDKFGCASASILFRFIQLFFLPIHRCSCCCGCDGFWAESWDNSIANE